MPEPILPMKKLIYLIAVFTAIQACKGPQNNATSNQIIFNGTADNTYNGQSIILWNNSFDQTDTAKIVDGNFNLKYRLRRLPVIVFTTIIKLKTAPKIQLAISWLPNRDQ
jgi:hypothetical protein